MSNITPSNITHRALLEQRIVRHVVSVHDLSDTDLELIWELIFAVTYSKESEQCAREQMIKVIEYNDIQRNELTKFERAIVPTSHLQGKTDE